ncbi:MAG: AbrB/MazE/SpoVT family DNA-binding domain-containing protein [Clostridiales bacterium]|nr:AbrB/MazE/SpoVT family DNA-binding domain-containing protein [Clostridiales bacterium]
MMTAKIFENGRSQAVRLPKECRFNTDEVMVNKIGEIVILAPKSDNWESFAKAIDMFSDDFLEDGRAPQYNTERESL